MKKISLIGPLPPPNGGARVSFKAFYNWITDNSNNRIIHYDLPVRKKRYHNPPGRVDHIRTLISIFLFIGKILWAHSIVIFGSRNFCVTYGSLLLIIAYIFNKKTCIRFFGGHPYASINTKLCLYKLILPYILNLSNKIIVETQVAKTEFPSILQSKIFVIPGYRKKSCFVNKKNNLELCNTIKFVYVSEISERKGINVLLDAFTRIIINNESKYKYELHIYGAGSKNIIKYMSSLNNVYYHGIVDNNNITKHLNLYDAFIFPSQYVDEGHPGCLIEALMAGLPVITTNLPGPREIITNMVNGIIIEPNNKEELANAMIRIGENEDLRNALSKNALETSKYFDQDFILPKLASLLEI